MSIRKLTSILITALILFGVSSAFGEDYKTKLTLTLKSGSAIANPTYDVSYTLTVPESMTISNTGWNAIGSMTVAYSGTGDNVGFSPDKKLVVTAGSTNDFKLVANGGSSSISYFLATSESGTKTTTFEFTAAQITAGASQTLGVNVEDFTSKANGTYTDEIVYSVEVQSAASSLLSLTISSQTFYYVEGETWSQAISNHSTENANWSIANGGYICYNNDMNQAIYNTTIGTYIRNVSSITANTVIDATQGWTLQ